VGDFERYAPAVAVFFGLQSMVPIGFGAVVLYGGSPVTPDQYGEVVYAIPAWVWAAVQLTICIGAAVSALRGWRIATAIFCTLSAIYMETLAAAAAMAGATGTLVMVGCGLFLGPVALFCAGIAWRGRDGRAR
jgi:hypothetical protein